MPISLELLTPKDTARLLGVSVRTLARWHSIRKGPARITVGRKVLFRHQAVIDWLRANETHPTTTFSHGAMRAKKGTQE